MGRGSENTIGRFAPFSFRVLNFLDQRVLLRVCILAVTGGSLGACMGGGTQTAMPLAPKPPQYKIDIAGADGRLLPLPANNLSSIQPSAGQGVIETDAALNAREVTTSYKCRAKDRFDRDALVAYEWDRSRFSVDVDGVNPGGSDDRAVMLEYRLRLQPEKPVKEKCRYQSNWQGMIGTGYHEFFVREEDTVMDEAREFKQEIMGHIDRIF